MNFDDVLVEIGEFGKFQKLNFVALSLAWMFASPLSAMSVFALAVPEHRCTLPTIENDSYEIQGEIHQKLINQYIPVSNNHGKVYAECHVYQINQSSTVFDNNSRPVNATVQKCTSWVYSHKIFKTTFVMEADLVCDNKYKKSLSTTIYFGGMLVGSLLFGLISDILGRKKALLLVIISLFVSSLALAWANSYVTFVMLRFCSGIGVAGWLVTTYVMGMEWTGPSKRYICGTMFHLLPGIGGFYQLLMAYVLRKWELLEITLAVPVALYGLIWWFIPESSRWLCNKGRIEEASVLLRKAAKVNKKNFPEKIMHGFKPEKKEARKVWLLFSNRTLALRTVVISFNWMVASMVTHGLALNTGRLAGDFYVNFLISRSTQFPAVLMPFFMMERFGRKKCQMFYMLSGGLACVSTIFTVTYEEKDIQPLTTALAMFGLMFMTGAFITAYVYSAELFPTVVRNAGMGASSCWARVGAMASSFIADIADVVEDRSSQAVPLVIFGGLCLLGALLTLTLPETLHHNLPESIEDAKNYTLKKSKECTSVNQKTQHKDQSNAFTHM